MVVGITVPPLGLNRTFRGTRTLFTAAENDILITGVRAILYCRVGGLPLIVDPVTAKAPTGGKGSFF